MQVLKIQPQTFKSSYIKLIALLWSLVYSLLFAILEITISDIPVVGILTIFSIFGVAYMLTVLAYIIVRNNSMKDCQCLKAIWFIDIAYYIAGILYYTGTNLPNQLFQHDIFHENTLQIAQPCLLGTAIIIYRFIPFFISKYYQSNLAKEHQTTEAKLQLVPEWILAAESLTLLVEFEGVYSVMINSFGNNSTGTLIYFCNSSVKITAAWVLWALFVLMYMFILLYTMNIQYCGNCSVNKTCVISNFSALSLLIAFGMHLLTTNSTLTSCFEPMESIFMKILVLIVVITVIVLLLVHRCLSRTRQEKLLPRALYQHLHPERNDLSLETANSRQPFPVNNEKLPNSGFKQRYIQLATP